jgi:hypothetical protein
MTDLLELALEANGGLERWSNVNALTAKLALGGPFWALKGFPDAFATETLTLDVPREHTIFTPWIGPDWRLEFDVAPERVTLKTGGGQTVESRLNPRGSYAGYDFFSPWDALQVGYFLSYAMWNYLTAPYLFTLPGVESAELEPWNENGERWRRLHVTFPNSIATHTAEQTFYYDTDGLQRRHDYTVDVNAGAVVAQYTDQHKTFDGFVFPTRRRVYRRHADGSYDPTARITNDINDIAVTQQVRPTVEPSHRSPTSRT